VEAILKVATIIPAVNQIEFHPYLQRANSYIPWLKEQGIEITSSRGLSPLRNGLGGPLDGPLKEIAIKHGVPENAVLIQWKLQQSIVFITTTSKSERISEYLKGVDLKLTSEEVKEISRIGLMHHFRAGQMARFDPEDRS
jgi:diketogulonate reductase-like aldo/keto reductase